jgi:hypothetical protein
MRRSGALEVPAAEKAVGLHVPDDRFDGRAAAQLALDDAEDVALLAGDEDAEWIGGMVATITSVDTGALDGAVGDLLGGIHDGSERVSVVRVARALWREARTGRRVRERWW